MRKLILFILDSFPGLKHILRGIRKHLSLSSSVSSDYVNLQGEEALAEGKRLQNSWQDDALPKRQRELVDQQLKQFSTGVRIDVFDVLIESIRVLPDVITSDMSLLEIGCSSGFYSEVLQISKVPLKYFGCDYSNAFINLAREKYPDLHFQVEDATHLSYPDFSFDIVVSGCCILHIPEYVKAIKETTRVSKSYCIFHRTPIVWGQAEQWYRKKAYGCETVEIHFNETEFLDTLDKTGLEILMTYTLHEEALDFNRTRGNAIRTYVCKKKVK